MGTAARKKTPNKAAATTAPTATTIKRGSAKERILAIDVGGTGLKAAIIDAHGKMETERLKVATPHPCPPDLLVHSLVKLVEPLLTPLPPTQISIGFPGVVRDNHVLTAPNLGNEFWRNVPLAQMLTEQLGNLPVRTHQRRRNAGPCGNRREGYRARADAGNRRRHRAFPRWRTDAASRTRASSSQQEQDVR